MWILDIIFFILMGIYFKIQFNKLFNFCRSQQLKFEDDNDNMDLKIDDIVARFDMLENEKKENTKGCD